MPNDRQHATETSTSSGEGEPQAAVSAHPEPFDFVISGGSARHIADVIASQPEVERDGLIARVHQLRGNRIALEVEASLLDRGDPLAPVREGVFDLTAAQSRLVLPSLAGSRDVVTMLAGLSGHELGVALVAFDRNGLLENFLSPLPYAYVEAMASRIPRQEGFGRVLANLRPYYEDQDRSDNSVTGLLKRVPYAGDALAFGVDGLTFGFASEHDAAYRAKRSGLITEDEYVDRSDAAGARATAVAAMSIAGGGAAASYAQGFTGELAATGLSGRMTSTVVTGAVGGAGAGAGAQLGSDAVSGQLSSPEQYAHSIGMGAGFGAAGGAAVGAVGETLPFLPASVQSGAARLAQRFPAHADIFDHYRAVGEAHALHVKAWRLHELFADGAASFAQPQLAAAVAGMAPDTTLAITGQLDDRGVTILHAEKLETPGPQPVVGEGPAQNRPPPGSATHEESAAKASSGAQPADILKRHNGSIRGALQELNGVGLTQEEMIEALTALYRSSGRDIGGSIRLADGSMVLLSRRLGPNQPINVIRPSGRAEFGRAELYLDVSRGPADMIAIRDVVTDGGEALAVAVEKPKAPGRNLESDP